MENTAVPQDLPVLVLLVMRLSTVPELEEPSVSLRGQYGCGILTVTTMGSPSLALPLTALCPHLKATRGIFWWEGVTGSSKQPLRQSATLLSFPTCKMGVMTAQPQHSTGAETEHLRCSGSCWHSSY